MVDRTRGTTRSKACGGQNQRDHSLESVWWTEPEGPDFGVGHFRELRGPGAWRGARAALQSQGKRGGWSVRSFRFLSRILPVHRSFFSVTR